MLALLRSSRAEYPESQYDLRSSNQDGQSDQNDDNPGDTRHLVVRHKVRKDLCQIEEHPTSFVQYLYPRFDFQILSNGGIQGVQRWFAVPDEIWGIEHVRGCMLVSQNVSVPTGTTHRG